MDAAVTVRGLRKRYGATVAVDDVSLDVAGGEIFGLLGPNGSGKTTTVECLQGLRRPDEGTLSVFGFDPCAEPAQVRRLVGSQLQDSALPERLKVWEALRLFSVISPGGPPWERLLDEWGLTGRRNTAFGDLSGGQRQRLFVALALISEPRLVVLDEMTTGLDPAARRVAWDLVAAVRERGTTVVLVTHFMDEAQRLCDRLAVLLDGHVVARGTTAELIASQPRSSAVRSLHRRALTWASSTWWPASRRSPSTTGAGSPSSATGPYSHGSLMRWSTEAWNQRIFELSCPRWRTPTSPSPPRRHPPTRTDRDAGTG